MLNTAACACGVDIHAHVVPERFPAYTDAAIAELRDAVDRLGLVGAEIGSNVDGTLAMLLPRLQRGWKAIPVLGEPMAESPAAQARRLFYDTLVHDAPTLRHLIASFGTESLMPGTDHSFNFHDPRPLARLDEAGLDAATRAALAFGNAQRLLGGVLVNDKDPA